MTVPPRFTEEQIVKFGEVRADLEHRIDWAVTAFRRNEANHGFVTAFLRTSLEVQTDMLPDRGDLIADLLVIAIARLAEGSPQ